MEIIRAKLSDAIELTELTLRSKNHWEYGLEQIEAWKEELTVTPQLIESTEVYKCIHEQKIVGYYAYDSIESSTIKLSHLFIDPDYIGNGIGQKLLQDFLNRIDKSKAIKVVLDADPNAQGFYSKYGFNVIGQLPSSIAGRSLPIMELRIK